MSIPSSRQRIIWRICCRSSPEDVYAMLATNEGRAKFWAESAVETDGAIGFRFINGEKTSGRILERTNPSRFCLEYFGSKVEFDLRRTASGGTDATLTNTGFDPHQFEEILAGWLNVLFPLKAAVDHGIDLRNRDGKRTWEDGYVDQ